MKDIVIVKSKTINNESVPIVFNKIDITRGGIEDTRELSRSFVFRNFKAKIPLKLAQIIVKQNPQEFTIIKALGKKLKKSVKRVIRVAKEKREGFVCQYCGKDDIKSKAGLTSHTRYNHPEKWEGKKITKKKEK